MRLTWISFSALLVPVAALAANKEHEAIQRGIGLLDENVKTFQRAVEGDLRDLKTLVQQLINSADKNNTSILILETKMSERMGGLEKAVNIAVAGMSAKVDSMSDEFRRVREDVSDLNRKLNSMQNQMADVKSSIQLCIKPPEPPKPAVDPAAAAPVTQPQAQPQAAAPPGPPAGVTAEGLFTAASRDKSAGKYDIALQEFEQYVQFFPKNDLACVAHFHIADIHYRRSELEKALAAFDKVVDGYDATCARRPDAIFMKGETLAKGGEKSYAVKEFRRLRDEYPKSDWAAKAASRIRELGFALTAPGAAKKRASR